MLTSASGVVLLLDFQNYVSRLDPDHLLVWNQHYAGTGPTEPVVFRIFRLSSMRPLEGRIDQLSRAMREAKEPILASAPPLRELELPTTVVCLELAARFPSEMQDIDELLVLCHSSGVDESPSWQRSNLALMRASPLRGTYELLPQDWFNSAGLDYGYQWVTRVARDRVTRRVHGDGIRISPFVLDDTLRHLR